MSLFSAIILPHLEKELMQAEPQIAEFLLNQARTSGEELIKWAESKLNIDINGDGKIGDQE